MGNRWTLEDIQKKGLKISSSEKPNNSIPAVKNNQPASFALGRLKQGQMNKTEAAYARHLEVLKQVGKVQWYAFEPMNLRLADKCFFKIDFLVMLDTGQLECHEVKGFWTDDALVKIKTAAEKFPFKFIAVRLVKGEWEVREF